MRALGIGRDGNGRPHAGVLPAARGFVTVAPAGVQLSSLRKTAGGGLEVRVVEVDGRRSAASVEMGVSVAGACETNLLGTKLAEVSRQQSRLDFTIDPWKIRTYEVTPLRLSRPRSNDRIQWGRDVELLAPSHAASSLATSIFTISCHRFSNSENIRSFSSLIFFWFSSRNLVFSSSTA